MRDAQVSDSNHEPIRGLFAAGTLVGGIVYYNYLGSSDMLFGSIAGSSAARAARRMQ